MDWLQEGLWYIRLNMGYWVFENVQNIHQNHKLHQEHYGKPKVEIDS